MSGITHPNRKTRRTSCRLALRRDALVTAVDYEKWTPQRLTRHHVSRAMSRNAPTMERIPLIDHRYLKLRTASNPERRAEEMLAKWSLPDRRTEEGSIG